MFAMGRLPCRLTVDVPSSMTSSTSMLIDVNARARFVAIGIEAPGAFRITELGFPTDTAR